jgi:CBS domain-containing protein
MSVRKLARVPAASVTPELTVIEAVRMMNDARVGAVAVLLDGRIVGMFSERDVMTRIVLAGRDAARTPVGEVMTRDVAWVSAQTSVGDALRIMMTRHIRHLPVLDDRGGLYGMLSMRHVVREHIDILSHELDGVANYAGADGIGG